MPGTARTLPSRPSSPTSRKRLDVVDAQRAVGAEDSEGDGKIEAGAFFFQVGGREVDGDEGGRNEVAGVLDGGAHAVAAFAHRRVGQADGVEDDLFLQTTPL